MAGYPFILANIHLVPADVAGGKALAKLRGNLGRHLDDGVLEENLDIAYTALGGAAFVIEQPGNILGANADKLTAVHEQLGALLQGAPVVAFFGNHAAVALCGFVAVATGAVLGYGLQLAAAFAYQ